MSLWRTTNWLSISKSYFGSHRGELDTNVTVQQQVFRCFISPYFRGDCLKSTVQWANGQCGKERS